MKKILISALVICAIVVSATGNVGGSVPGGNNAPTAPIITGPTSIETGEEYEYTFNATDPDDDTIKYYIEWGDGSDTGWIGPYESGEEITLSHTYTWYIPQTYTIRARAKDSHCALGPWGYLDLVATFTLPDDDDHQQSQSSQGSQSS